MPVVNGLTRRWRLPDAADAASIEASIADRILRARGLVDPEAVRAFCDPRLNDLHDPRLLPGIDAAAERLLDAVRRRERIAIYGDYDVDGIAASAILFHLLRRVDPGADLVCYVPHRLDEGYGLNADALRTLRAGGASLVVTVDCGVTATEPARTAREIGLDLIVTDHHEAPTDPALLPEAIAIVHPALPGSRYPFPELCGAGVAFKLAWRLATGFCGSDRVSDAFRTALMEMLPLAALGTIADVVPLRGENRVLVSAGLRAIRGTSLVGLRALIDASGLGGDAIDSEKVGFVLAPRLNACGRLGHAADAVRLLTDAPPLECETIARRLAQLNRERQETERAIVEAACRMAEASGQTEPGHRAIVLADPGWHPGVIGIVCSRLVERYGRPTVLLQRDGDSCRGSARSVDGYSIHAGLCACAAHLARFGGHEMAAGLVLPHDRLEAFRRDLVAHANAHIEPGSLVPSLRVDCDAAIPELDGESVRRLARLGPFGRGNPRPALRIVGARVADSPKVLKERHLKCFLRTEQPGRELPAIWFDGAAHAAKLRRGARIDAVVEPKISDYDGRVEAIVRDMRVVE